MVKLKSGFMNNEQIAKFFNITIGTLKQNKKYYSNKLKSFCISTPVNGGFIIEKIFAPNFEINEFLSNDFYCWGTENEEFFFKELTKEEKDIIDSLIDNYTEEEKDKIKEKALIEDMLRNREISIEDYFAEIDDLELDMFENIKEEFYLLTKKKLVRGILE